MQFGIEHLFQTRFSNLRGRRLGLLLNQASIDRELQLSCEGLAAKLPGQLKALFSPQHGIWGEQQANMVETEHGWYEPLKLPIYSLYSQSRRPTAEMLEQIDCLLIDLQDVGTRVYTFVWTMLECLRACAEYGKTVVVCDRPNPLGGEICEGPLLDARFRSFVGNAEIPLRHGLTMGELARLFVLEQGLDVDLLCIPMRGWRRAMTWAATGRPWIWPSPNMPTTTTVTVYPGQVLLEGTNLSEGRGTTRPFELAGAPFLDPHQWMELLAEFEHPGLELRPVFFRPTFDKWQDQSCGGIELIVKQPEAVRSVASTLALILTAAQLAPEKFDWLDPPYEYEYEQPPINVLFGNQELAEFVATRDASSELGPDTLRELLRWDAQGWQERITPILIYS